jgi:hypothetical protein
VTSGIDKALKNPEWRKDARLVVYRISKTGRRALATLPAAPAPSATTSTTKPKTNQ